MAARQSTNVLLSEVDTLCVMRVITEEGEHVQSSLK